MLKFDKDFFITHFEDVLFNNKKWLVNATLKFNQSNSDKDLDVLKE